MNKQRIKKLIEHLETCEYVSTLQSKRKATNFWTIDASVKEKLNHAKGFNMVEYFMDHGIKAKIKEARELGLVPVYSKTFRRSGDLYSECKSPSCMAGHAIALFYREVGRTQHSMTETSFHHGEFYQIFHKARIILELQPDQARKLFTPRNYDTYLDGKPFEEMRGIEQNENSNCFYHLMTPQAAIRTLHHLLKTEEVVWFLKSDEDPRKEVVNAYA